MAAPSYTYTTVLDEVRFALGVKGTDAVITDAEIKRFIFSHVEAASQSWNFSVKITAKLYTSDENYSYGLMLIGTGGSGAVGGPTFTGENDCVYVVNAKGSVEVSSGTPTATNLTVSGARVNFPAVMIEILHFLATHRCQEISVSMGGGSITSGQVYTQLMDMADYWQGIKQIL